ncbi:MAG: 16S rRNA (uracil(1498)-N(3))-methyltransferase [Saprospiraceae bacterium]|nr:16S rRNA (uracil(1498)-N(3))-methyltransferase [Saprospiraceae bacterium]
MRYFFAPDLSWDEVELDRVESHHLTKVLRAKEGDSIHLLDGAGTVAQGRVAQTGKSAIVKIERRRFVERSGIKLTLAVAPPKQAARLDWMIEKCTELGIYKMVLMTTARSERRKVNQDRLYKVALSAIKQSGNPYLPELSMLKTFSSVIEDSPIGLRAICTTLNVLGIQDLRTKDFADHEWTIAIGPEGGFTSAEILLARKLEFAPLSLGSTRLRTETAALLVASLCRSET